MPNWCENFVVLTHSNTTDVDDLHNVLKAYPIDNDDMPRKLFGQYLPILDDVADKDICDVNVQIWGTKWEPLLWSFQRDNKNSISLTMDTAWTPPIGFYQHFVNCGWVVEALYHEPNNEFCGRFTNLIGDELYEYNKNDLSTIDKIPKEVLDFSCFQTESETGTDSNYDTDDEHCLMKLSAVYTKERNSLPMCLNKVTLSHKNNKFIDDLESFLELTLQEYDSEIFNLLFPRPDDVMTDNEIFDWNLEAWGTHCEPEIIKLKRVNINTIHFMFKTAFTPPTKLYQFLVEEKWDVDAMYHAENARICGNFTNQEGDIQYSYDDKNNLSLVGLSSELKSFVELN